jgi:hypothetical protein
LIKIINKIKMSQNNAEHTTGTVASPHIPKVSGEDS